jgi:hypothetical protein
MADIAVSANQWNEVSADERERIVQGLRQSGILGAEDKLVPSGDIKAQGWNPIKDICKAACDVAAGTAIAWCTANTGGAATALCVAAAEAAREECKRHC